MTVTRRRRGTALLATLFAVAILASVAALTSRGARSMATLTANRRAQMVAHLMAESGVIAARAQVESLLRHDVASEAESPSDRRVNHGVFDAFLDGLSTSHAPVLEDTLDDGIFIATIVNASARLDVNAAGREGLETLFRSAMDAGTAQRLAAGLDARVRGGDAGSLLLENAPSSRDAPRRVRDSLRAVFTGTPIPISLLNPFESLDEVEQFLGDDARALAPVAEHLTVDGDATIDRRHAPPAVLAAASGSLDDRPSRLVIIARGWQRGAQITREIQAVFAIQGSELRLVRWRETNR